MKTEVFLIKNNLNKLFVIVTPTNRYSGMPYRNVEEKPKDIIYFLCNKLFSYKYLSDELSGIITTNYDLSV